MSKNKSSKNNNNNTGPEVIVMILVGLPGSGKSTLSQQLEKFGWIRANQDDLGTAEECKKVMNKAIKHKKCVIIDRCNVHAKERKMWLTDAKKSGVTRFEAVYLNPGVDECKRRVRERKKHPTLSAENGDAVIDDFMKGLTAPESWEGFEKISVVTNGDEYKQLVKEYQSYEINKKPL